MEKKIVNNVNRFRHCRYFNIVREKTRKYKV